jgi:hypothetical protein
MNIKAKLLGAAMGALGLCGLSSAALAGSTNPPGERAGLDMASPLPEGVYFVDLAGYGNWRDAPSTSASSFAYNVPVIAWSTPWNIFGGHFQLYAAAPEVLGAYTNRNRLTGLTTSFYAASIYNPWLAGQLAWNLGNGFSVSLLSGAYIGIGNAGGFDNAFNHTTFQEQLSLAYHMNGWNATANLMVGILTDQGSCSAFGLVPSCQNNDYFNYDLALTHTFGKWELGMVAYGSTDFGGYGAGFNQAFIFHTAYANQSQFALGGLMGYNFGPVIMQFTVSTDVYTHNYATKQTQGTLHVIVPLWAPEAPKAVIAKY